MEQYNVTGMSCAACSARVEKAVSKVPGVESVAVSLLTNSMGVTGTAEAADIIKAVTEAGYGARKKGAAEAGGSGGAGSGFDDSLLEDTETPKLKKRLGSSLVFLLVLMYFTMGHMMLGFPLPGFFEGNCIAQGLVELLLTIIIMLINGKFFVSGFTSLIHRAPNMDTLVALGASAAFVYSLYALFAMTGAVVEAGPEAAMPWMDEFYFESSAMILTLITIGKTLEAYSKGRTTDALKGLMRLAPKTANVERDGQIIPLPVEEVRVDDIFVVKSGESIPVDGIVLEGNGAVDESALTGESIPVDKEAGMEVSAATINRSGYLRCRATRVGRDTALSQIIQMVSDAAATKAPVAKAADRVSGVFVPAVIGLALITTIIWLALGHTVGFALARGISVLVISCPCALGLATPVAIMVGSGVGAKNGIMFKTAVSLEETGKVRIVALDKTGTITRGQPLVTDVLPAGMAENDLMEMAAALEFRSEHPLGRAVVEAFGEEAARKASEEVSDFKVLPGSGISGIYRGSAVMAGNLGFIEANSEGGIGQDLRKMADNLASQGKTPLFFMKDGGLAGIIAVADPIKEDSREAINQLHGMGLTVVMITGDNQRTAEAIGEAAGIDRVYAGVLPEGKAAVIRELQKKGPVAMIGDGINDAPALTRADMGIAIGAGTDVAIDAADLVLMKSSLLDAAAAIRLSRAVLRNIHENLFWAFIYNIIGIPLAAGAYISLFGWELNPMFGAAAMSLSSFCVVTNALRINLFKLYDPSRDRKIAAGDGSMEGNAIAEAADGNGGENTNGADGQAGVCEKGEESKMEKKMHIEGMMCHHCEMTVKKALEALDGVESAVADHENNVATLVLSAEVSDELLKQTVEDKDFSVTGIE